jgi:N-acetylglutamate synthase-like GNAT family acetyltransferase
MEIVYRSIQPEDYNHVRQLLIDSGWQHRVADLNRFKKMIERADRAIVASDGEQVVGFARALCDESSNGYISTVVVAEGKRRKGIGRGLVERLMEGEDAESITWVLRAGRGSEGFWEKMGFKRSGVAMERVRKR